MRADELMFGDWVNAIFDGEIFQGRITRINGDTEDIGVSLYSAPIGWEDGDDADDIDPIPLTEEILMKNFPTPDLLSWFPLDTKPGYFNVYWYGDAGEGGEIHLNIQYVHELQHILKLCNINKEIEL